jgi:hypothetical protein
MGDGTQHGQGAAGVLDLVVGTMLVLGEDSLRLDVQARRRRDDGIEDVVP